MTAPAMTADARRLLSALVLAQPAPLTTLAAGDVLLARFAELDTKKIAAAKARRAALAALAELVQLGLAAFAGAARWYCTAEGEALVKAAPTKLLPGWSYLGQLAGRHFAEIPARLAGTPNAGIVSSSIGGDFDLWSWEGYAGSEYDRKLRAQLAASTGA